MTQTVSEPLPQVAALQLVLEPRLYGAVYRL
jgi:hypothetical protein